MQNTRFEHDIGAHRATLAHLHDELNWTDEITKELEDQVLLFLLHLIETEFLSPGDNFRRCQTMASVGLEKIFSNWPCTTGLGDFLVLGIDASILRLKLLNQRINVLVVLFSLFDLLASVVLGSAIVRWELLLLVKLARRNALTEMVRGRGV